MRLTFSHKKLKHSLLNLILHLSTGRGINWAVRLFGVAPQCLHAVIFNKFRKSCSLKLMLISVSIFKNVACNLLICMWVHFLVAFTVCSHAHVNTHEQEHFWNNSHFTDADIIAAERSQWAGFPLSQDL